MPQAKDTTCNAKRSSASLPVSVGSSAHEGEARGESLQPAAEEFDFADIELSLLLWSYFGLLFERKWTILLSIVVMLLAAAVWTKLQKPTFRARATVQIDLRSPKVLGKAVEQVEELGIGSHRSTREYLKTQLKIVKSRVVARRVVDALALELDSDFAGPPDQRLSEDEIADTILSETRVVPLGDSRLFEITFDHFDPGKARAVTNALADAFLAHNIERRNASTIAAASWLVQQLEELRVELGESERALYAFEEEHGVHNVLLNDPLSVSSNQLGQLNSALSRARERRITLGAWVAELQDVSSANRSEAHIDGAIENPLVRVLKMQHAELVREQEGLARRYGKGWPRVIELDERIVQIEKAVQRETSSTLKAMESQYRASKLNESALGAALKQAKGLAIEQNRHESAYLTLERHQKNNERLFGLILERTREAEISRMLEVNNFRVLDYAPLPDLPIEPKLLTNLLIGLLLGLLLGVGIGMLLDVADQKVRDGTDLALLGVTLLGLLPSLDWKNTAGKEARKNGGGAVPTELGRELFVQEFPHSVAAEMVRTMRTRILFMTAEQRLSSLLVTSAGAKEGKTTVTVSLATALAQRGTRVVIVDTDLRRPRVSSVFQASRDIGVTSVIMGHASLAEALRSTPVKGLSMLPCGPIPPNPSELLHSMGFEQVLKGLAERFDLIIFDSPPLMAVTDAAILGTHADGVLLVTRAGFTRKESISEGIRVLETVGARVLGAVLNNADLSREELGNRHDYGREGTGYSPYGEPAGQPLVPH